MKKCKCKPCKCDMMQVVKNQSVLFTMLLIVAAASVIVYL